MSSFMEQEIMAQPQILGELLASIVENNEIMIDVPSSLSKVFFVASGSSFHCARTACEMFNSIAKIDAACEYSSEFIRKEINETRKDVLFVFLSQSGETTDTCTAATMVKEQGFPTLSILNKENSKLWNMSDYNIYCNAGPENTIASTKALTAQLLCSYLLMLKLMQNQGKDVSQLLNSVLRLPEVIENVFNQDTKIKEVAEILSKNQHVVVVGSNFFLPIAQEASLKIKETSFVNANAYPFGEFLHGHVAVFNNGGVLIAFADDKEKHPKFLEKIMSDYSPKLITFGMDLDLNIGDINFKIDEKDAILQLFATLVTCQLFALNCATMLGRDIDNPHGLTKVVS